MQQLTGLDALFLGSASATTSGVIVGMLILDRDGAAAAAACAELGDRARYREADIADPAQTEDAVTALTGDGTLSYVVNCAGIHQPAGVEELTAADWTRMLNVNLVGACSGGITLSALLGFLAPTRARKVHSATLAVCVLDMSAVRSTTAGLFVTPATIAAAKAASRKRGAM